MSELHFSQQLNEITSEVRRICLERGYDISAVSYNAHEKLVKTVLIVATDAFYNTYTTGPVRPIWTHDKQMILNRLLERKEGMIEALTTLLCPEDPPPPAPAGEPSPETGRSGVTQTNRVATEMPPTYTPDLVPIALATGAATLTAVAARPWYARAAVFIGSALSRAATGVGGFLFRGATLVFPVVLIGPPPMQNPHPKPDWT